MIPRIIHQFWGGSPLPDELRNMSHTWKIHHPEWTYRWWDESSAYPRLGKLADLWDRASEIVPADAVWQFRSDLLRWSLLWQYGGVWADVDSTCQRPLDELLTRPIVAGWEIQDQWVGTSVFATTPRHPVVREILDITATTALRARPGTRPNRISGPKAVTAPLLRRRRTHGDVRILDEHVWYPVRWDEPERSEAHHPDAWVVHHWAHQRALRGIPIPATSAT